MVCVTLVNKDHAGHYLKPIRSAVCVSRGGSAVLLLAALPRGRSLSGLPLDDLSATCIPMRAMAAGGEYDASGRRAFNYNRLQVM